MTEQFIRDILARVELRNAPLPVQLYRVQVDKWNVYISVRALVPDRDTGEPTYVYNHLVQDVGLYRDVVRAEQMLLATYEQLLKGVP